MVRRVEGGKFDFRDFGEDGSAFERAVFGDSNGYLVEKVVRDLENADPKYREALQSGNRMDKKTERGVLLAVKEKWDKEWDRALEKYDMKMKKWREGGKRGPEPEIKYPDSSDPEKPFANDLRYLIEMLTGGLETSFYSTIGNDNKIDRKGIDAFIFCSGELVTLDATIGASHKQTHEDTRSEVVILRGREVQDYDERAKVISRRGTQPIWRDIDAPEIPNSYLEGILEATERIVDTLQQKGVVLKPLDPEDKKILQTLYQRAGLSFPTFTRDQAA